MGVMPAYGVCQNMANGLGRGVVVGVAAARVDAAQRKQNAELHPSRI